MYCKMVLLCSTQGLLPAVEEKHLTAAHIKRLFIFVVMWSVGALLELDDRVKMEVFLKQHNAKLDLPNTQGDQTIFEFVVSATGEWDLWSTRVRPLFVKYNVMIFYYSMPHAKKKLGLPSTKDFSGRLVVVFKSF